MSLRQNDLARIKVSGEDVFVLELRGDGSAIVRRPQVGTEGIVHRVEEFTQAELCTPEEFRSQMVAEKLAMRQQLAQLGNQETQDLASMLQVQ